MKASATQTITPIRSSAHVRADIEAVENEAGAGRAEAARLAERTRLVLVGNDDAVHEQHEAEIARQQRIVARADARLDELHAELRLVEACEAQVAGELARVEAEAAVNSVSAKAGQYTAAAETIAAFLAEWQAADRLALAARIPGPAQSIGRLIPGTRETSRTETFEAYADEFGRPTQSPHPYKPDGSIDRTRERRKQAFVRDLPDVTAPYRALPNLVETVNLPKLTEHGEHHRSDSPRRNTWQ